jgi:hypothetical protein
MQVVDQFGSTLSRLLHQGIERLFRFEFFEMQIAPERLR